MVNQKESFDGNNSTHNINQVLETNTTTSNSNSAKNSNKVLKKSISKKSKNSKKISSKLSTQYDTTEKKQSKFKGGNNTTSSNKNNKIILERRYSFNGIPSTNNYNIQFDHQFPIHIQSYPPEIQNAIKKNNDISFNQISQIIQSIHPPSDTNSYSLLINQMRDLSCFQENIIEQQYENSPQNIKQKQSYQLLQKHKEHMKKKYDDFSQAKFFTPQPSPQIKYQSHNNDNTHKTSFIPFSLSNKLSKCQQYQSGSFSEKKPSTTFMYYNKFNETLPNLQQNLQETCFLKQELDNKFGLFNDIENNDNSGNENNTVDIQQQRDIEKQEDVDTFDQNDLFDGICTGLEEENLNPLNEQNNLANKLYNFFN